MALIDVILLALLVLSATLGFRRGAILQLFTYGGLLLGIVAGALLAPITAGAAEDPAAQAAIAVATLLIPAGIGDLAGWLIGGRLRARARGTRLGPVDAAGGSLVGLTATALAIWLVSFSLANGPIVPVADQIQRSAVVRGLEATLPEPPSILAEVRRFFNVVGFPDVFAGVPPVPAAPVEGPSQPTAKRAFRAAEDSTVRVVGEACGRIQQGSGFLAGDGLVVTNAHVIAGERSPTIEVDGRRLDATAIVFDPRLDIAILRVSEMPGPVLRLADRVVPRGSGGAVVGYPGGQGPTGSKAAVRSSIQATSRDIYGHGRVDRRLYELQTSVVPGNSGGPFVLTDGHVAGVVVSASTANPKLGYAIASTEVRPLLEGALTQSVAVATGACPR